MDRFLNHISGVTNLLMKRFILKFIIDEIFDIEFRDSSFSFFEKAGEFHGFSPLVVGFFAKLGADFLLFERD